MRPLKATGKLANLLAVLFLLTTGLLANWQTVSYAEWSATVPNPIMEYSYTYDNNGNITDIYNAVTVSTNTFIYDEVNRLTQATGPYGVNNAQVTQTYSYDAVGNIQGVIEPIKDANGNATSYNNKTIEYDYENRPTKITDTNNNTVTEFAYDYSGQRVYTKVSSGTITSEDYYVGNIYEESYSVDSSSPIISASTTTVTYVYAGSIRVAGLVSETTVTGTKNNTCYYHGDHLGSSSIITDGSGTVIRNMSYQPWGNKQENTKPNGIDTVYDPKHKFTGQILDDSTGLYYYGARYYDPTLRRFITPDTIVQSPYDPQLLNRYSYCRNNPILYKDPSGHFPLIFAAMAYGALFNTIANVDRIHGWRDFGKIAGVGALQGALTYGTGGAGAAGLNRVIAQGITSVFLGTIERGTGMFSRNGGYFSYMMASAMVQGYLEHGIYTAQSDYLEIQNLSQAELNEIGTTTASRAEYIDRLKLEQSEGIPGGTQLSGIKAENWQKVKYAGELNGIIGRSPAFRAEGSFSPLIHTASAAATGTGSVSGFPWYRYLVDKGVCHQSVAAQFWASGLQVSPTQLYHTWDAYLSTGAYGPIGGTGAFASFQWNNYTTYDINKK